MQGNRRLIYDYLTGGSCDCSYSLDDEARFRVNIFRQQGHFSIVLRKLEGDSPIDQSLGLPPIFRRDREGKNRPGPGHRRDRERQDDHAGRACSTRSTKPSRSTSSRWKTRLNSCIRSARRPSTSANSDTISTTIQTGFAPRLRQAPKVILVGEMRDRATVEVALMAAETGHLVLSTLHTVDAGQSINRILGLFSLGEEQQLRIRLADTLRYVVSQRLAPKVGGGRQLLTEILGHNLRTQETIALGEGEHRSFYEIIEASSPFGWMTFDQSILNAYENDLITEETARSVRLPQRQGHPRHRPDSKSARLDNDLDSGLRLDLPANAFR